MGDEITAVFTRLPDVRSVVGNTAAVLQNGRLWPGSRLGLARYYSMSRSERNTLLSVSVYLSHPPPLLTRTDLLYCTTTTRGLCDDRPPATKTPTSLALSTPSSRPSPLR